MGNPLEVFGGAEDFRPRDKREIARIVTGAKVAVVRVAADVHRETAELDAIEHVVIQGMQSVVTVTQIEQQLAQTAPAASGRLAAIADTHAFQVARKAASFSGRLR